MTLPIHDQGGLTEAEIDLRINESQREQVTTLEQKLKEHQQVIEGRISVTDSAVKNNLDRIIELKTNVAVLMASDTKQTELLQSISDNGNAWHEADIDYRSTMIQRVSSIETEQKLLSDQVRIIRWFVATSAGITKTLGVCLKIIATEEFWKLFSIGLALLVSGHYLPKLYTLLNHILTLSPK